MKRSLLLPVLALGAMSCGEPTISEPSEPRDPFAHIQRDTFNCPLPVGMVTGGTGPRIPAIGHIYPRLSPNGEHLSMILDGMSGLRLLQMPSGTESSFDLQSRLPEGVQIVSVRFAVWCPYDATRLLVQATTRTDTTGDGRGDVIGENAYIIGLGSSECLRVTPSVYGRSGARSGFAIRMWLAGSSNASDSLLGTYSGQDPSVEQIIYVPQSDIFLRRGEGDIRSQSRDGRAELRSEYDDVGDSARFWINGVRLVLPTTTRDVHWSSWSPDGSLLALSAMPKRMTDTSHVFEQIWIVDMAKLLTDGTVPAPTMRVDPQERFCSYAMRGHWPEFTSNRTLAVSMHKDGDQAQLLWEITTDGRKVRQITATP